MFHPVRDAGTALDSTAIGRAAFDATQHHAKNSLATDKYMLALLSTTRFHTGCQGRACSVLADE